MRFYDSRKAEMLNRVGFMLNKEQQNLIKKVPALKQFIAEFIEREKELHAILTGNPNVVMSNTMQKKVVKVEFVKAVWKLIVVLKASGYKVKGQPIEEMIYTKYALSKLSAEKLCMAYVKVFGATKKISNREYYGLTAENMRDMQAYYNEFAGIKNAPALKKKEAAANNSLLNKGIKECIGFLENHIDSLMYIAAEDDEELMRNYKSLRLVLPRGQGRPSDKEASYRESRGHKKKVYD